MDSKTLMDWVTFGIAVLGAGLGVFNAWRDWVQSRTRLRVKVSQAIFLDDRDTALAIDVVNLSGFPVTITHIGFFFRGTDKHAQIFQPVFAGGETLPERLESRAAIAAIQPFTALPKERWAAVRCVYVQTACGHVARGGERFFRKYGAAIAAEQAQGF